MRDFKKLKVWQAGRSIATSAYRIANELSKQNEFVLSNQVGRSGVSIPSNIAEGSSRKSEKDKARFIEIALGSCFELETQLIIMQDVGMMEEQVADLLPMVDEEEKMLMAYLAALRK